MDMNYKPKFTVMESRIRETRHFFFLKLNWGLENDNTLFKKREHLLYSQNLTNDNTLFKN